MKPLPCPKCGAEETIGTFCKACQRELHALVKSVKEARITLCENCDRVHYKGSWKRLKEPVTKIIAHAVQQGEESTITATHCAPVEFEMKPGIQKTLLVPTTITGRGEGATEEYTEEYEFPLEYQVTLCTHCKKQGTTYFEGVLQVRNETTPVKEAINSYMKKHKGVHITKTVPLGNGSDYFLTDHRAIGHIAQHLHKRFGGELKVNAQHFSHDKQASKNLYRTNAFVSLPEYKKGDVILFGDQHLLVKAIVPKIMTENLASGEKRSFPYRAGEAQLLPQMETQITSLDPLEALHPVSFEPVTPKNKKNVALDEKVMVAVDGENVFFI